MFSALVLNLLLLVPIASAGHHYGGSVTFTPKGINPDGSRKVEFRIKRTYDVPDRAWWSCVSGDCGNEVQSENGQIDTSTKGKSAYYNSWTQTETVVTRNINGNTPFDLQDYSCCWVPTVNNVVDWLYRTHVDLGTRNDTNQPNRSPATTTLQFLRVPQNCPRTYRLPAIDPDGDQVRCRYGILQQNECATCSQPSGFQINQDACTLDYSYASDGVYGFELIVEDFARKHTTLSYTDGSSSYRCALSSGRHRRSIGSTPLPWYYQQTTTDDTTSIPPTNPPWWWWVQHSTTEEPTTTTEEPTTTTDAPTTTPWWWWQQPQTTTTTTQTNPPRQYTTSMGSHQHSYQPFSKLPLQFSVFVDSAAPSCVEGYYIPHFVSPTPSNGEKISAKPLHELEFRVKATAAYATLTDVIISGPLNITKHALSNGEYAIRWTPRSDDFGDYFPVCFIAESMSGSSVYQSEMRCVIVVVGRQPVNANVICSGTNMAVEIEQLHSVGLHKDYLRLNNPACTLDSNGTHVLANFSLNACGTIIEEDEQYIIFKNEIVSTDDLNSIITRKHEVEIEVSCRFEKKNNISIMFNARRHITTITEKGFGTLTYSFELFQTAAYNREIDVTLYPAEYDLGEMIYMQIESQSAINNTELFVESCVATPYNDPNYQQSYTIIKNGCIMDETVQFYTDHQSMVRFGIQAFQFIGMQQQVFISCSVIMCEANNPNTRCSQGCVNSTAAPPSHHPHKREAPIQTGSHFVSQGPLRLRRSAERVSSTVLNLNMVFIAGCLLAAVGMVCGVLIYRTRRTEVKYQPLRFDEI